MIALPEEEFARLVRIKVAATAFVVGKTEEELQELMAALEND